MADLTQLPAKLKAEIASLQDRRLVAENELKSMDNRRKVALEALDEEIRIKRRDMLAELNLEMTAFEADIAKLTKTKNALIEEVAKLNEDCQAINYKLEDLRAQKADLESQIESSNQKLAELDGWILDSRAELKSNRGKIVDLQTQIREIGQDRDRQQEDKQVLEAEIEGLENEIIRLDSDFKYRKETLDNQIKAAQRNLEDVLEKLKEANSKDKQLRQSWAEENLKLEKRTEAVRKMEARVSDAERRIAELDNYMRL